MKNIKTKDADKIQLLESRSHWLEDRGTKEERRAHAAEYSAVRAQLGISVLEAQAIAWIAVRAWHLGVPFTDKYLQDRLTHWREVNNG